MTAPMGKTLQPAHYGILFYSKGKVKNRFKEIRYPHKRDRKKKGGGGNISGAKKIIKT